MHGDWRRREDKRIGTAVTFIPAHVSLISPVSWPPWGKNIIIIHENITKLDILFFIVYSLIVMDFLSSRSVYPPDTSHKGPTQAQTRRQTILENQAKLSK